MVIRVIDLGAHLMAVHKPNAHLLLEDVALEDAMD
jgi:hypothetical protein